MVWPLADNLGTVRDLAESSNGVTSVVNHRVINAYGDVLSQTNPATGTAAAVDCVFGYTGGYTDPDTGLVLRGARWYDPAASAAG